MLREGRLTDAHRSGGLSCKPLDNGEKVMNISYEKEIFQSPEIVFPWIADPEKAMKWQKNVQGGEIIINKPDIIGTTFKEIIQEDGNHLEMHGIITKYVKNKIIGFHLVSRIHEFDVCYSVEELNNELPRGLPRGIRDRNPQELRSKQRGIIIPQKREKSTKISIEANIHWKFPMNIIGFFIRKRMEEGFLKQLESEVLELQNICENNY
jgi:hypothetical protein